jgi:hypothetical protein
MKTLDFETIYTELDRLYTTEPINNFQYYQISLRSDEQYNMYYQSISHWVGFTNEKPPREIRQASLINPKGVIDRFALLNQRVLVLNTEADFHFFRWVTGGCAIIESSIAERHLIDVLQPNASVKTYDKGFVCVDSIPPGSLNRAPSPKLRMKVLDRDKRRCKICGGSPANNEHVELHLHHIIPYSEGGITDASNLITLCHTCHKGLVVHTDFSLFQSIGVQSVSDNFKKEPSNDLQRNIVANLKRTSEYTTWIKSKLSKY